MPNRPGEFMKACDIIKQYDGNIIRVSYNEGVNLFIEVEGENDKLDAMEKLLGDISFVETPKEPDNLRIVVKINDVPGALYPVLQIFNKYKVNISYLNSYTENKDYQNFSFGFNITDYKKAINVLHDISKIYLLNVTKYVGKDKDLDNVVKFIRIANNMQTLFAFQDFKVLEFIHESFTILEKFNKKGVSSDEIFSKMEQLVSFISFHSGVNFVPKRQKYEITPHTDFYCFEPPCGSNAYVFKNKDKLLIIDTGMGIFSEEMIMEFRELFPAFYSMDKIVIPTHADVYHCGLIDDIERCKILMTRKTYDNLNKLVKPFKIKDDDDLVNVAYNRLNRIVTDYHQPARGKCKLVKGEGDGPLVLAHTFKFGDLKFEMYEGNGGHLGGETVIVCREKKIVFTGDVYNNEKELESEDIVKVHPLDDSDYHENEKRLAEVRKAVRKIGNEIGTDGILVCFGHGPAKRY